MKNEKSFEHCKWHVYLLFFPMEDRHRTQNTEKSIISKKKKKAVSSHHHKAVMPHQISNLASAALKRHRNEPSTEEIKC